jgi:hypothetical protein
MEYYPEYWKKGTETPEVTEDVHKPEVEPTSTPLGSIENILKDRKQAPRDKINLIAEQIQQRKNVHQKMLSEIANEECDIDAKLMLSYELKHRIGLDRVLERRIGELQAGLWNLGRLKREQDLTYWGDYLKLKLMLQEAVTEYKAASRRDAMVSLTLKNTEEEKYKPKQDVSYN